MIPPEEFTALSQTILSALEDARCTVADSLAVLAAITQAICEDSPLLASDVFTAQAKTAAGIEAVRASQQ